MWPVRFTEAARAELIDAQDWYEAEAPGRGRRFRAEKILFGPKPGLASKGRILNIAPSSRLLYDKDVAACEQKVFRTRINALR